MISTCIEGDISLVARDARRTRRARGTRAASTSTVTNRHRLQKQQQRQAQVAEVEADPVEDLGRLAAQIEDREGDEDPRAERHDRAQQLRPGISRVDSATNSHALASSATNGPPE